MITPGNETDFGTIISDILDLCLRFKVLSVAYDPWGRRSSLGRDEAATRNTPYPATRFTICRNIRDDDASRIRRHSICRNRHHSSRGQGRRSRGA